MESGVVVAVDARRARFWRIGLLLMAVLSGVLVLTAATAGSARAAPGSWSGTASLSTARSSLTATRLFGGKVLVAGGSDGGGQVSSAELFDPDTGTWGSTGGLATARSSHTATLLSGPPFQCGSNCGKVVVVGGLGAGGRLASAEVYNPAAGTWSAAGSLATARSGHTATLLSTGRILVTGGTDAAGQPLASAEVYNPAAGTWSATGSLATARSGHTATILSDGRVLVAGGTGPGGTPLASAEVYDPPTGNWSPTGSLSTARSFHTATALGDEISGTSDRRVLVAGGTGPSGTILASTEIYDPGTGTWTATGSLGAARSSHTAALVANGKVVVSGGDGAGGKLASAEVFDPGTGAWSATGSLANARSSQAATVLLDGRILDAGGLSSSGQPLASSELYDPNLGGRWSPTAPLANARSGHTATLLPDGDVLVAGGHTTANFIGSSGNNISTSRISPLASSELYHPATGTWTPAGDLREARSFHTATLLTGSPAQCGSNCGKVLVTGGQRAGTSHAETVGSAELYDPATGQWRFTAALGTPRYFHTATRLRDGKVLVVAGADANGVLLASAARPSAPGSMFAAWAGCDSVATNTCAVTMTSDRVLSATFTQGHTIPLAGSGSGAAPGAGGGPQGAAPAATPHTSRGHPVDPLELETARARGLSRCLATAAHGAKRQRSRARRACLTRYARTPGRVSGLHARALSNTAVLLSFAAPGSDGSHPPAARGYLLKQSFGPIRSARDFRRAQTLCNGNCHFAVTAVGARVTLTITHLLPHSTYYYAIAALDNLSNRFGPRSPTAQIRTR